ncbi:unnamed protein product [Phytophthora fragariaefolia]|uniref:Unnamed protein product n=1 Tax=Phytophthora fragariaefolia TaxID=1490495 RepID=A0A9W6YR28_9STRA|nr:unnamed protein product [Phytophthora fragariaefolia]
MSGTDDKMRLALLDADKFARFSSSTFRADKLYKTVGYGLGAVGHLLAHASPPQSETAAGLRAIASNISMARYVIRFTGGLESYAAYKSGSWCYGDDSDHVRRVVGLQALSMIVYYPLEHVSYVGFV